MSKKMWSIFTKDLDRCMYTDSAIVERHHVFGGANKALSEKYGFIAPLRPDLHPNGVRATEFARTSIDQDLKKRCQCYYEQTYGNREDFIREFGRSYL